MSKQLSIIEKKALPIAEKAKSLQVVDGETLGVANDILSQMNTWLKASEKDRRSLTDPLEKSLDLIRDKYRPLEIQLKDGIKAVKLSIADYVIAEEKREQMEMDKIARRVGEGRGHLNIETAARKSDEIKQAPVAVIGDQGRITFREDKKLRIVDASLIPREYLVVDESKVLSALKLGEVIPGAEIEIVKTVINRTK